MEKEKTKILSAKDMLEIFPFGKTKLFKLLQTGILPTVKIGNDYITSELAIEKWIDDNIGKELKYQ